MRIVQIFAKKIVPNFFQCQQSEDEWMGLYGTYEITKKNPRRRRRKKKFFQNHFNKNSNNVEIKVKMVFLFFSSINNI